MIRLAQLRRKLRSILEPQGFLDWWKFCIILLIGIPTVLEMLEGRFTAVWTLVIIFVYFKVVRIYQRRNNVDIR